MSEVRAWAVIPAAGSSRRMQSETPKQYVLLNGKPLLWHVLQVLSHTQLFAGMVLVLADGDQQGRDIAAQFPNILIAPGGRVRLESVLSGVQALPAGEQDWVFTHDAARPCVTAKDIITLHTAIQSESVGGILGYPVRDTLKQVVVSQDILSTVDRSTLWHAMTPQAFRYHLLVKELRRYLTAHPPSDDSVGIEECGVMEWAGHTPKMVRGRSDNIKVTYPEDLLYAELILSEGVCA
jgi:2-C-methyl-D-erythritol 4-phosphate cytidylyltransferase